jgi:cytochrome P450
MEGVIRETLRLWTPVPSTVIRIAQEDHYLGEFEIRKGTFVSINVTGLMQLP